MFSFGAWPAALDGINIATFAGAVHPMVVVCFIFDSYRAFIDAG